MMISTAEQQHFLAGIKGGDADIFASLVQTYRAPLHRVANRVVGCPETASEVVQDVFYRVWRNRDVLEIRETLGAYLMRAARNRALDHVKRRRVEAKWRAREEREQQVALDEQVTEYNTSTDNDWRHLIERALARLPERRRQVLMLRWREGLSYEQIAERMDISVKTVDNQIGRGLKTLRAELARSA